MSAAHGVNGDEILDLLREEVALADSPGGRWYSEYLAHAYRTALGVAMALVRRDRPRVLKTDLWNECLGGERDVVNHLTSRANCDVVAIELALPICAFGRTRVPGAHVVQADILALPFRGGAFDAVVDLSTLDHVPEARLQDAVGEYTRVLRKSGVLLLVFWQRNALVRLRLLVKRLLGRVEKPGQRYFRPSDVRSALGQGVVVAKEFVAGSLLTPPHRLTGRVIGRAPRRVLSPILRGLVRLGHVAALRPLLAPLAGLHGIVAIRRDG